MTKPVDPVSTGTGSLKKWVFEGDHSAEAETKAQTLVYANSENKYSVSDYENTYVVSVSGTDSYIDSFDKESGALKKGTVPGFTYGVADPTPGKSVRISVYSLKEVEKDGATSYATNRIVGQTTARVENLVKGSFSSIELGTGKKVQVGWSKNTTVASKSKPYVVVDSGNDNVYWDVTGATVVTNQDISMAAGRVGAIHASGNNVEVNDGTVEKTVKGNNVKINGGNVGAVTATADVTGNGGDVTVNGGTVASITADNEVVVSAGTVSGAVSAKSVVLEPVNEEEAVSVGAVSAKELTINGTYANASAASFTTTMDVAEYGNDSTLTLMGSKASVDTIDVDYFDTMINLQNFVGTISAPANAKFTGYEETGATLASNDTDTEDATKATVSGNLNIRNIELNGGEVTFNGSVTVNNVYGGEATMVINAGELTIIDSVATANTLKISNAADVVNGTMVYRATADIAEEESFVGYGYTVSKTTGGTYDSFIINGTEFAGLTMSQSTLTLPVGQTATLTASAYPLNTSLPEGATIKFYYEADEDYLTGKDFGGGVATVTAVKYDPDFAILNKGTFTAMVVDADNFQLEQYGVATCVVTVVPEVTISSDTTHDFTLPQGSTYQFKLTSSNGTVPVFKSGNTTALPVVATNNSGNDYFYTVRADGQVGEQIGIYADGCQGVNENNRLLVITIGQGANTAAYECDTDAVTVAAGASYQVEITSATRPVLLPGNSSYTVEFVQQVGNNYYFRITAATAQPGDQVGFYINGGAREFIATTV